MYQAQEKAMQFVIPQHMQDQKAKNIKRWPALAIELTAEEISRLTPGGKILALTSHQKAACRLLAAEIGWHPMYCGEVCPTQRPALLSRSGDSTWEAHCQAWQDEHDLPVPALATKYRLEFERVADRLFEPLDRHSDGVLMSTHDNTREKYPCAVAEWT
jgi:hypothetical protein